MCEKWERDIMGGKNKNRKRKSYSDCKLWRIEERRMGEKEREEARKRKTKGEKGRRNEKDNKEKRMIKKGGQNGRKKKIDNKEKRMKMKGGEKGRKKKKDNKEKRWRRREEKKGETGRKGKKGEKKRSKQEEKRERMRCKNWFQGRNDVMWRFSGRTWLEGRTSTRPSGILTIYWPMILMCPCIIDFIGGNGLQGWVGGRGPWTLLGPLPHTHPSNPFPPMKSIIHGHIRISGQ
jgi:hypothetical protein